MKNVKKSILTYSLILGILLVGCSDGKEEETVTNKPKVEHGEIETANDTKDVENENKEENDMEEEGENVAKNEEEVESPILKSGDVLFETEYIVEDYQQGRFIVSKGDGLLYGVLDMEGNTIIPVKYDDIYFFNDYSVNNGNNNQVIIYARYEDTNFIFDAQGNELIRTSMQIDKLDYEISDYSRVNPIRFYVNDKDSKCISVYDGNANCVIEIDYSEYRSAELWAVSENCCILALFGDDIPSCAVFFDKEFNKINTLEMGMLKVQPIGRGDTAALFNIGGTKVYELDEYGEILATRESNYWITYSYSEDPYNLYLGNNQVGNKKLYMSNGTGKLTTLSGQALYDERYFDCKKFNNTYLLMNEDSQWCVIDKYGNRVMEYGYLTVDDREVCYNGEKLYDRDYIVGEDGIVIPEWTGKSYAVRYFFNEKYRNSIYEKKAEQEKTFSRIEVGIIFQNKVTEQEENGNLLKWAGFEEEDNEVWRYYENEEDAKYYLGQGYLVGMDESSVVQIIEKEEDSYESSRSLHFWNASQGEFSCMQMLEESIPEGTYQATALIQGDSYIAEGQGTYKIVLCVYVGEYPYSAYYSDEIELTGWQDWKEVKVSDIKVGNEDIVAVGVYACWEGGEVWGTVDDFYFGLQK